MPPGTPQQGLKQQQQAERRQKKKRTKKTSKKQVGCVKKTPTKTRCI
jgi:hypothetical protein